MSDENTPNPTSEVPPASEASPSPPEPSKPIIGLWLTADYKITVSLEVYKERATGMFTFLANLANRLTEEQKKTLNLEVIPITAIFSVPHRSRLLKYRRKARRWEPKAGDFLIDRATFHQLLIRYHLLELTVVDPETDKFIELKRDEAGRLLPEVEEKLDNLHPILLGAITARYEIDANLTV